MTYFGWEGGVITELVTVIAITSLPSELAELKTSFHGDFNESAWKFSDTVFNAE